MRNKALDEKSLRFIKLVFDNAKESFDSKDFDFVKAQIIRSLRTPTVNEKRTAIETLAKICKSLGVDTRVTRMEDFVRIMTGASFWSHQLAAFAMALSFDESSRKRAWIEVEGISSLPIGDLEKISGFFDSLRLSENSQDWRHLGSEDS
jgi:hypothetical protein